MDTFSDFVEEDDIDYEKVLASGGENCSDDDFAIFGCPFCHEIYLLEYEVDTVYTDPHDLKKRIPVWNSGFACVSCGEEISIEKPWIGPKAPPEFKVRYTQMLASEWAWILNRRI